VKPNLESLIEARSRDPKLLTWYRFVRFMRKIISMMDESMRNMNANRYQFDLLIHVAQEDGINQQRCADRMNVTKGNITQHLDRLEEKGLVRRQKQGRANCLHLTEASKELMTNIIPDHDQRVKEILSPLTQEELRQFQSILRKLDRELD
jgi:DNA-binding MarR family transcriptional regulator